MTQGMDEWSRDPAEEDDDDDDDDDEIVFDDDEDEFGLPSLASMRRKKSSTLKTKDTDPGGSIGAFPSSLGFSLEANRQRANSSDIAEERGAPMYPTARKGEGKILRPQYKDILQGIDAIRDLGATKTLTLMPRSCKCLESHQSHCTTHQCYTEGERDAFEPYITDKQIQAHFAGEHGVHNRIAGLGMVWRSRRGSADDLAASPRLSSHE